MLTAFALVKSWPLQCLHFLWLSQFQSLHWSPQTTLSGPALTSLEIGEMHCFQKCIHSASENSCFWKKLCVGVKKNCDFFCPSEDHVCWTEGVLIGRVSPWLPIRPLLIAHLCRWEVLKWTETGFHWIASGESRLPYGITCLPFSTIKAVFCQAQFGTSVLEKIWTNPKTKTTTC